jgi:regulator of sigma E protease
MSRNYFEAGLVFALQFMAMISVSLGIMNLLPIPPLDGGRFVIELIQRISGKTVPTRVVNIISAVGIGLMLLLFVVMLNQDIQRFVFGNW